MYIDKIRFLPFFYLPFSSQVRSPPSQIIEMLAMGSHSEESTMLQDAGRHYTLEEIMEEGMLYEELLNHLRKSHSADRYSMMDITVVHYVCCSCSQ